MKMSALAVTTCLLFATHPVAQDETRVAKRSAAPPESAPAQIANPFELSFQPESGTMMGMETGMDSGVMSMDMGMGMDMDRQPAVSDEELFRYRLRTAISKISDAKDADEKAVLLKYTQAALREQYDVMIAGRTADLDRLKQRLAMLEADLQKRAAAKDRVVKLQMQSVILAAEGLLDLNSLQSTPDNGAMKRPSLGSGEID